MVLSATTKKGRRAFGRDALQARGRVFWMRVAVTLVVFYNFVGLADIASTTIALAGGFGAEANPVIRTAMENFGPGWIVAKLMGQALISFMVLWFPHRIVLGIFSAAIAANIYVVISNFQIAGVL